MPQPIAYVDTSEVRAGRLEEFKAAMDDLKMFVEANEPQLLAYNVYFSNNGTLMTVLHINLDSPSLEFHMKVAGPMFHPIREFINVLAIDVYGRPGKALVDQLRHKAQMLVAGPYVCTTSTPGLPGYPPASPPKLISRSSRRRAAAHIVSPRCPDRSPDQWASNRLQGT